MNNAPTSIDLVALIFKGAQCRSFLQGMATNNIDTLQSTHALPTFFCQYQGKLFASGYLIQHLDDEIWLLCSHAHAKQAIDHLSRYALLSRVTLHIQNLSAEGTVMDHTPPIPMYALQSDANGRSMMISAHCQIRWSVDQNDLNTRPIKPSLTWQAACIEDGIPVMDQSLLGRFTPNQLGLVPSVWVRLDKGCYCGQEIIARTFHLGKTQRQLVSLSCQTDGIELTPGTTFMTPSGSKLLLLSSLQHRSETLLQVACSEDILDQTEFSICTPQAQTIACQQVGFARSG